MSQYFSELLLTQALTLERSINVIRKKCHQDEYEMGAMAVSETTVVRAADATGSQDFDDPMHRPPIKFQAVGICHDLPLVVLPIASALFCLNFVHHVGIRFDGAGKQQPMNTIPQ